MGSSGYHLRRTSNAMHSVQLPRQGPVRAATPARSMAVLAGEPQARCAGAHGISAVGNRDSAAEMGARGAGTTGIADRSCRATATMPRRREPRRCERVPLVRQSGIMPIRSIRWPALRTFFRVARTCLRSATGGWCARDTGYGGHGACASARLAHAGLRYLHTWTICGKLSPVSRSHCARQGRGDIAGTSRLGTMPMYKGDCSTRATNYYLASRSGRRACGFAYES
jgi:hypothetical protein